MRIWNGDSRGFVHISTGSIRNNLAIKNRISTSITATIGKPRLHLTYQSPRGISQPVTECLLLWPESKGAVGSWCSRGVHEETQGGSCRGLDTSHEGSVFSLWDLNSHRPFPHVQHQAQRSLEESEHARQAIPILNKPLHPELSMITCE